jgi:trehalose 2-sulfotransferase
VSGASWVRDLVGAEHDQPPGRFGLRRSYLVCSTPRSGSSLLCRGLASTGVLGTPLEYLNPVHREILSTRWGCGEGLDDYLAAVRARRTGPGGVFGAKVHWAQLDEPRQAARLDPGELLERLAPGARFVRIVREDRDAQAVSLWRAFSSGVWSVEAGDPPVTDVPEFDVEAIDECRRLVERGELAWDLLLAELGQRAVTVTYEELAADHSDTVRRVAQALGAEAVEVGPPTTGRLSDERSSELVERFRRERAQPR